MSDLSNPPQSRRPGNPAMVKGGPSLNPHGRPPVGLSLATAIRKRFPPERIVSLAEQILAGEAPPPAKLRALELLARRGYGSLAALERQLAGAPDATGSEEAAA